MYLSSKCLDARTLLAAKKQYNVHKTFQLQTSLVLIRTSGQIQRDLSNLFHLMLNVTVFQQAIHSLLPLDIFHLAEGNSDNSIFFPPTFFLCPPPSLRRLRISNVFAFRNYAATGGSGMVAYWLSPGTRLKREKKGDGKLCRIYDSLLCLFVRLIMGKFLSLLILGVVGHVTFEACS